MAHAPVDSLVGKLENAAKVVQVGATYRHYKTKGAYMVLELALDEESEEPCVIYQSPLDPGLKWVRSFANFTEELVENGKTIPRFQRIG